VFLEERERCGLKVARCEAFYLVSNYYVDSENLSSLTITHNKLIIVCTVTCIEMLICLH
jgi:hypothetical protein